jgi:hypothetical protein
MKTDICTYPDNRDEAIVEYLYDDLKKEARAVFETHLARCSVCRAEIDALTGVRQVLSRWAPPEPIRALEHAADAGPRLAASSSSASSSSAPKSRPQGIPLWAQAAAAVLCIGVGLGAANLRVGYGPEGLSVRTGWMQESGAVAPATPVTDEKPWQDELVALEQRLRADMKSASVPVAASPQDAGSDATMRQLRTLIAQSEQRQQRELALRIGDLLNDVQVQRRADLSKIDRSIGLIQNSTGMEVLRQREMLNSLAVRVSQRP